MTEADAPSGPVLRVVSGRPDDTELAAIVAVLLARPPAAPAARTARAGSWGDPAVMLGRPTPRVGWRPLPGHA